MKLPTKNPLFWFWLSYTLFLFYGTLIPFDLKPQPNTFMEVLKEFMAKPFLTSQHLSRMDLISNLLLFIPFGFLGTTWLLIQGFRPSTVFFLILSNGFLISFCVELLQAYSPSRISSFFDVLLNTASCFGGIVLSLIFFYYFYGFLREGWLKTWHEKPIFLITLLYGLCLYLGSLFPFDFSIQISDLKQAIKEINWIPFRYPEPNSSYYASLGSDFLFFTLFSGLTYISLRLYAISCRYFFLPCWLWTGILALGIEFSQLFVIGRQTESTDLVIALLGGFLGTFLSFLLVKVLIATSDRESSSPLLSFLLFMAVAGYSLISAYLLLSPLEFDFSIPGILSRLQPQQLIPFYAYWANTNFYALQDLLFSLLLFVPLGFLLNSLLVKKSFRTFWVLLFCILWSTFLEGVQIFQPSRCPELTDVLSATTGSCLGLWIGRKLKL